MGPLWVLAFIQEGKKEALLPIKLVVKYKTGEFIVTSEAHRGTCDSIMEKSDPLKLSIMFPKMPLCLLSVPVRETL